MEDIRSSILKVEMVMISLVISSEVCSEVATEVKDSIEAVSIRVVLDLLVDLVAVDSEVVHLNRKVLMLMPIFPSALTKQ